MIIFAIVQVLDKVLTVVSGQVVVSMRTIFEKRKSGLSSFSVAIVFVTRGKCILSSGTCDKVNLCGMEVVGYCLQI